MAVLIAARGGRLALGPPRSGAAARARLEPGYSPRVTCRSGRKGMICFGLLEEPHCLSKVSCRGAFLGSVGPPLSDATPIGALAAVVATASRPVESGTVTDEAAVPVPRSIAEVDNGKILGFGAKLSEEHPGFGDEAYEQRRMDIVGLAARHTLGEAIPAIDYSPEEVLTWGTALRELEALYPTHACAEFLRNWELFQFREDTVPQLEDLSQTIMGKTGWQIRPVAGLLHPRDFLNGLAFRTFHSTQYMRHPSQPMYTPEPDVIHEMLGHVVMLADPAYCKLVETIGLASLGASEKEIWHLTKVYWYTVEFGVVRQGGEIKAFGAGILSSFGELQHMKTDAPSFLPFDPFSPQPKMSYKDGFQSRYFVMESFKTGCQQLSDFAATLMK